MKKITRWYPDTCGCVIDFEWDTDNPNDQHTGKEVVKACPAHQGQNAQEHYSAVLNENKTKNIVLNQIEKVSPELVENGKVSYFFDENRKLNVIAPDLVKSDSDAIIASIGSDKVKING